MMNEDKVKYWARKELIAELIKEFNGMDKMRPITPLKVIAVLKELDRKDTNLQLETVLKEKVKNVTGCDLVLGGLG